MAHFLDGPAQGRTLHLRRAPVMLRVAIDPANKIDALDQLNDSAQPAPNQKTGAIC